MELEGKTPDYWEEATTHLSNRDEIMAEIIKNKYHPLLTSKGNVFLTLIRSIVGQQISNAAAESVWVRLQDMLVQLNQKIF